MQDIFCWKITLIHFFCYVLLGRSSKMSEITYVKLRTKQES